MRLGNLPEVSSLGSLVVAPSLPFIMTLYFLSAKASYIKSLSLSLF